MTSRTRLARITASIAIAFALVLLVACDGNGGGGGAAGPGPGPSAESIAAGNCADAADNDGDTLVDGADPDCAGCNVDFTGGQADGNACYRDAAISQGGCGQPFRLFLTLEVTGGQATVTVTTQSNPGGGGGADPSLTFAQCTSDCTGDDNTFSCDVTDSNGVVRTVTGTLSGNNIIGTIETTCGDIVSFVAQDRPDGDCPTP
jgi:hypothetical protein